MRINKKQPKINSVLKVTLWVIATIFIVGGVFLAVEMATTGSEVEKLNSEESDLLEEGRNLKLSLVESSSLNSFEKNSDLLGFSKPDQTLYITEKDLKVAKLP